MERFFNTGGPCRPEIHYMLPAVERLPREVRTCVRSESYFVMHAPRQTGKTTSLLAYARKLTEEGRYAAALVSMQPGATYPDDPREAEAAILDQWRSDAEGQLPDAFLPPAWPQGESGPRVGTALKAWARACPRPLVLFLDEIDALSGQALVSVLHQIRAGHPQRPRGFPVSLALVGLRDLKDYKFASGSAFPPRQDGSAPAPSPFNILVSSLTLANFTRDEIASLYAQHTEDTGQAFPAEVVDEVYRLTRGQPWLVNALARIMVEVLVPEPGNPITLEHLELARLELLRRRDMHLDTLANRLVDPRVRTVLEPLLTDIPVQSVDTDSIRLSTDLGLVRRNEGGSLEISNPIYRDVLFDQLLASPRESVSSYPAPVWQTNGRLDPRKLLDAFLEFWLQHGSALMPSIQYPELAPHLIVMAFMMRVTNGGGRVQREEPVASGRLDLLVQFGADKLAIEFKVWRPKRADPLEEGLQQLENYMRHLGTELGWLFIFDRREGQPRLVERLQEARKRTPGGLEVVVMRL